MVQALFFASGREPSASCWQRWTFPPVRAAEQDYAFALPAVGAVLLSLSALREEEGQDRQQCARQLLCVAASSESEALMQMAQQLLVAILAYLALKQKRMGKPKATLIFNVLLVLSWPLLVISVSASLNRGD